MCSISHQSEKAMHFGCIIILQWIPVTYLWIYFMMTSLALVKSSNYLRGYEVNLNEQNTTEVLTVSIILLSFILM